MRNKRREVVQFEKVPAEKSKVKFSITLNAEWDYNNDLIDSTYDDSPLVYEIRNGATSFHNALARYISNRVFDRTDRMFDTYTFKAEFNPAVEASFQATHKVLTEEQRAQKQKELADLEAKAKRLKEELR